MKVLSLRMTLGNPCALLTSYLSHLSSCHGLTTLDAEHIAPCFPCCCNASSAISPLQCDKWNHRIASSQSLHSERGRLLVSLPVHCHTDSVHESSRLKQPHFMRLQNLIS